MICSRCTTELPAMANTCPQCGLSIPQGQVTEYSYLPPGTPPWPTNVSERLPYLVESKASEPFPAVADGKVKSRTRARSLGRRVLTLVLVLLITPVLGILGTIGFLTLQGQFPPPSQASQHSGLSHLPSASDPNPFSSSSGDTGSGSGNATVLPAPAPLKSTSDASMNISVQYPSDWTAGPVVDPSSDPLQFPLVQPNQLIHVFIARFSTTMSSQISGPDQLNTQFLGLISQTFPNVKSVASPDAEPTIGNDRWMEQDATYTDNNVQSHFATITVLHNRQNYYNISFAVPQSVYQQAMQQYIQPILDSLQFIS